MALFDSLLVIGEARGTRVQSAAITSTAEILLGKNIKFWFCADQDTHLRFGATGLGAADATDMYVPVKTPVMLDTGNDFTAFRAFNASTTTTANIHYIRMSQF